MTAGASWTFSPSARAELAAILGPGSCSSEILTALERAGRLYGTFKGTRWQRSRRRRTLDRLRRKASTFLQEIDGLRAWVRVGDFLPTLPAVEKSLRALTQDIANETEWLRSYTPTHRPPDESWRNICIGAAAMLRASGRKATTARPEDTARRAPRGAVLWRLLEVLSREVRGADGPADLTRDVRAAVAYVDKHSAVVAQMRRSFADLGQKPRKEKGLL